MTVDEEKRKCSFIHSLPTGIYQCLRSHLSVFFSPPDVILCVFVAWIQLSGWRVKSLTASLRLARTGRQRRPREGERRTETWDRPGLLLGRSVSVQPSAGGMGEKMGVGWGAAAVSFNERSLLSSAFNLQARPAFCPVHPHTPERPRLHPSLQVIPK